MKNRKQGAVVRRKRYSRTKPNTKAQSDSLATVDPKGSTAITGFGISHTYDLLRRGVMPSILVGRRFYIPRAALIRWLENCGEPKTAA